MQIYLHWQPPPSLSASLSFLSSPSPYCIVSDWFSEHLRCSPSHSLSVKHLDRKELAAEAEQTISYSACNVIVLSPILGGWSYPGRDAEDLKRKGGFSRGCCGQGQGLSPDVSAFLGFDSKGTAGGNIERQKPRFKWSFSLFNMAADTLCVGSSCRA